MKLSLSLLATVLTAMILAVLIRFEGRQPAESRLPLHFDHGFHMSVACNTCHHNFARTEPRFAALSNQRCVACHMTLPDQAPIIETTFHDFCMGCHQRERLSSNPHGPLRECSRCHVRTPTTDLIVGRNRFKSPTAP